MDALKIFHEKTIARDASNEDALLRLIKAMCDDISVPYDGFNDSFFLIPFNTRPNSQIKQ